MLNMPTVVAVSNSAWLRGKSLGSVIDAYDVVVRFNGAATAGADDLGRRTTIWATSPPIFETALRPARSLLYVPCHLAVPPEAAGLERIPVDVEQELSCLMGLRRGSFPTTGLAALYFLLREYPHIDLAGWHRFVDCATNLATWWDYYDRRDVHKRTTRHDRDAEVNYVARLLRQGRVTHLAPKANDP